MKKIQFADDFNRIKSLIDESRSGSHEICLWQKDDQTQRRAIHNMKVESNIFNDKKIWMKSTFANTLQFKHGLVFYYCHELRIVFKTNLISLEDQMVCLQYPDEATLLEENDQITEEFSWMKSNNMGEEFTWVRGRGEATNDIMKVSGGKNEAINDIMKVSGGKSEAINDVMRVKGQAPIAKMEDEAFAGLRESARLAPKVDKYVTLIKESDPTKETIYKLFDLSQGGAGLLIFNPSEFVVGEKVSIIAIDQKPVDKILRGQVAAVRPYDEAKSEYKLGIKFS